MIQYGGVPSNFSVPLVNVPVIFWGSTGTCIDFFTRDDLMKNIISVRNLNFKLFTQ